MHHRKLDMENVQLFGALRQVTHSAIVVEDVLKLKLCLCKRTVEN